MKADEADANDEAEVERQAEADKTFNMHMV